MLRRFTVSFIALLLVCGSALSGILVSGVPISNAAAAAEDQPGQTSAEPAGDGENLPEGHSSHGEVFNEGPRQAAHRMDGVGSVRFSATTEKPEAAAFVTQGVAQLHGFWYFESERSFRQAAAIDPGCAIAYWGMAMSNRANADRAKGFIKEAMDRKDSASPREQLYIEAFDRYINAETDSKDKKRERAEKYIDDLENLLDEFPDDIEAKAFLCEFLWSARGDDVKISSYLAVNALIQEILDVEPLHPAHHYRIHLWDGKKPKNALESAARCGLAAPAIAHMWHMPGHIYSKLHRYHDAVYQQEASARVDHAHMMENLVLPDQIHNFAHNNEWCIRNLIHIGRVHAAIELAKNMIEMPRHPKYNHIEKSGSYKYGRQRLLDVLRAYRLHDEVIRLAETPWLEETGNDREDLLLDRALGSAFAATGRVAEAEAIRQKLRSLVAATEAEQKKAGDDAAEKATEQKKDDAAVNKARTDAEARHDDRIRELRQVIDEIDGRLALHRGEFDRALELFERAKQVPAEEHVAAMLAAGKNDAAVEKIADHAGKRPGEVLPLVAQIETLWQVGRKDDARKAFDELRTISSTIDSEVPVFAKLAPIAHEIGFAHDWRTARVLPDDLGAKPELDSLGPFRWQPVRAPDWSLPNVENKPVALSDYHGKPVVVIFYLGYGCLHCAEQLQKFHPETDKFREAGFELVAVSTDRQEDLSKAYENYDGGFKFPLVADPDLTVFKKYRCFDDFEQKTLHGTFVIDAAGLIRWQDISYEPFMDPEFVLKEAKRQIATPRDTPAADSSLAAVKE
ncbi:MAG: redoxin domain-containing protein [Planctomycetaceae bacterium]